MSEFISVCDLLVGKHRDKCPGIKELATAVENEGTKLFFFDRFDRYAKVVEPEHREEILEAIARFHEEIIACDPNDLAGRLNHFEFHFEENVTHIYGWGGELPDFEAIYAAWKTEKGSDMENDPEPSSKFRKNNGVWNVLLGGVMHIISTLPKVHSKELGRNQTVKEIINDIISDGKRSHQTAKVVRLLEIQGVKITGKTLITILRKVPKRLLQTFP